MATIDDIIATVDQLAVATDGSLTLAATDFAGIEVVQGFFDCVVGAQSYTLAGATRAKGNRSITVSGQADVLGCGKVPAAVTFATTAASPVDHLGTAAAVPVGDGVTVTIAGTLVSDAPARLPAVAWVEVDGITVSATIAEPFGAVTFGFAGSIVLSGDTTGTIPIHITRGDTGLWTVEMAGLARPPIGMNQLVALLHGNALELFLPSSLVQILDGLAVSDLAITFDATAKVVTEMSVGVTGTNGFPVSAGLNLEPGLCLALSVANLTDDTAREFVGVVTGTFRIDDVEVPAFVQVDVAASGTSTWLVGLDPSSSGVTLPSLSGLFTLAGGPGFTDLLPSALADLPAIQVNPLLIRFTPSPPQLHQVSFGATTNSAWPVVEDFLTVDHLALSFELVELAGTGKGVGGSLAAIFTITDDVWLYFQVAKDPATSTWTLTGGLPPGRRVKLTDLAATLLKELVTIPPNAPGLVFDTAALTVVPGTSMTFTAGSTTPWPLLDGVVLNAFTMTFSYLGREAHPFSGSLATTIALAKVPLSISARLDSTGIWSFSGSTAKGAVIQVHDLIDDLQRRFGVADVPTDALAGFTVSNIDVEFSAGASPDRPASFLFGCAGTFSVAGTQLDLALAIATDKAITGYTGVFTGRLTLTKADGTSEHVSVVVTGSKLTADWTSSPGHELGFADLAVSFGLDDRPPIPPAVDLTLTSMTLEYDVSSGGLVVAATSKSYGQAVLVSAPLVVGEPRAWYFGVHVDHAIDVSDLPLLKSMLPGGISVGFDGIQLAAASKTIDAAGAAAFNAIIQADPTRSGAPLVPAGGLSSRIGLSMVFHAGSLAAELIMPVAATAAPAAPCGPSGLAPTMPAVGPSAGVASRVAPDGTVWFDVQRSVGPLAVHKVGIRYRDAALEVVLNASISAFGLQIGLLGLGIGTPLTDFQPRFSLDGLTVAMKQGAVEVSGGLAGTLDPVSFYGALTLGAPEFTVNALGGYAEVDNHPSFFVYAVVDAPIGGPPAFFVTGLAAGLGLNRRLLVPDVSQVATFPLVQWAAGGDVPPATDFGGDVGAQVISVLARLAASGAVAPSVGDCWLAAGIRFTSYELVQSFVLLTFSFGARFEVDLLGFSRLALPPGVTPPVAQAELELKASFVPDDGVLSIAGQLTPRSYVLAQTCRLSGGFAACWWFGGAHAGDFVVTLGGYSPRFERPAHYPEVPKLEMEWQVSDSLVMKGDLYFAVTSGAVMAGGYLSALWRSGGISAWFDVEADFVMMFSPLHYFLSAWVHLGASFRIDLAFTTVTVTVHLGVGLDIWGPEFSGQATIDLSIISFTVGFGAGSKAKPDPIDWPTFVGQLMPSTGTTGPRPRLLSDPPAVAAGSARPAIVQITVVSGLRKTLSEEPGKLNWVVSGETFETLVHSAIPVKASSFKNLVDDAPDNLQPQRHGQPIVANIAFGVGPTATDHAGFRSTQTLTLMSDQSPSRVYAIRALQNVAKALWEAPILDRHGVPQVDPLNDTTIPDVVVGYRLVPQVARPDRPLPVDLEDLQYTTDADLRSFAWSDPSWPTTDGFANETVAGSIAAPVAMTNRAVLLSAMAAANLGVPLGELDVSDLASQGSKDLLAPPALRLLGERKGEGV